MRAVVPMHDMSDVVVVGGGMAGLAAARRLASAGVSLVVVEAGDRPGGRVATDIVDGYRLDRGFQVVNTAYPELPRLVDVERLDLRFFDPGLLVVDGRGRHLLDDPRRVRRWPVSGGLPMSVLGLARLARMSVSLGYADARRIAREPEVTAREYLSARTDQATIRSVVEPFLTGVFGYQPLATSSRVMAMIWRSFVRGRIGVPASGMSRLPELVAAPLPKDCLRLNTVATAVTGRRVSTSAGPIHARCVVIACDPASAALLLPGLATPEQRVLVTTYHAAGQVPVDRPVLALDGTGHSPIANSVVLTRAAPEYAPRGRQLIATTAPVEAGLDEPAVRRHLAWLYGTDTRGWEHVATVRAEPGLVAAPPPQGNLRKPVQLSETVFVAGDHRDTPSLQGALVSGRRAADAVLRQLGAAPRRA